MHLSNSALLLLAGGLPALSFVIPDEQVSNQVFLGHPAEDSNPPADQYPQAIEKLKWSSVEHFRSVTEQITKWHQALEDLAEEQTAVKNDHDDADPAAAIDDAFEPTKLNRGVIPESYEYWDSDAWVSHHENSIDALFSGLPLEEPHRHRGHRKHKCHHHLDDESEDEDEPPCQRDPPHHRPNPPYLPVRSHCPQKPSNLTLFDLISHSKHTTILYNLVRQDEELTKILKDTHSNTTLFAPDNEAFKKLPHPPPPHKDPKDLLRRALLYHLVNGTHGLLDTLSHDTLITKLPENELGKGIHQRLRVGLGLKGLTINYYSKIIKANIFAKNGVIHAVDSVLFPPITALEVVKFFPTVFSTSELAFRRTGLADELEKSHNGFTLFLPSNSDWERLGFKLNAFLFSDAGKPCLEALMKYHIVTGHTLYSDAHVVPAAKKEVQSEDYHDPGGLPQGYSRVILPTMLQGWNITADITRYGRFLSFRVNKFNSITVPDGIIKNGVIQVPDHVLIPPCKKHKNHHHQHHSDDQQPIEEMDVETFKACLLPDVESEL